MTTAWIQSVAVCHSLFCRELLASQGGVVLVVVVSLFAVCKKTRLNSDERIVSSHAEGRVISSRKIFYNRAGEICFHLVTCTFSQSYRVPF